MPKTDIHSEAETKLNGILGYFGIADGKNIRLYRVTNADVELLRKAGVNEDDIRHCLAVAGKALEIACRTGTELDLELIGRGALFHDLGKSKTHAIEHGKNDITLKRYLDYHREIQAMMGNS
jgi:uncharacterized protein